MNVIKVVQLFSYTNKATRLKKVRYSKAKAKSKI